MPKKLAAKVQELQDAKLKLEYEKKHKLALAANKELKASNDVLARMLEEREAEIEILLGLNEVEKRKRWERAKSVSKGEATFVAVWSDWHVEQVVRKRETNGLNEWNPKLAERAVKEMVDRTIRIHLPRYRMAANIDTALINLNGDFIEGHNRDEQKAYNAMSPIRATQFAYRLIRDGIDEFQERSGVKRIIVVSATGNHARTTEKMWASGRNDTNFETLIYDRLREHFASHPKIEWHSEEGELSYVKVYDYWCRFVHGDAIKYRGGRDGLSGPATLQIRKWNDARFADYTFFGDKHTFLWNDQIGFVANGALCGAAPYSMHYGRNRPCQAVAVIDREWGLTDATSVFRSR